MSDNESTQLAVEHRTEFGKGAARRLRAAGRIPAVLYGHGTEPQHLSLPGHETFLLIRKANAVLELDIQGSQQLALVKEVQRDPVRRIIEHIDLLVVRKGERVEVEVAVHLVGEPAAGTVHFQETTQLLVTAEATHIPESIEFSIEGLPEGTVVYATDVQLPKGVSLVDPEIETAIVTIEAPRESEGGEDAAEAEA